MNITSVAGAGRIDPLNLTEKQIQVLAYLRKFFAANHCLPPCTVMARDFGWASPNAADTHYIALERAGALERNELRGYKFTAAGLLGVELRGEVALAVGGI